MGLNGGGYTFINPAYLSTVTDGDVQAMFTDTKSFLMRLRKTDGTQPYIVLSPLAQYAYVYCYSLSISCNYVPVSGFVHSYMVIIPS